jgi:hypothetical protein
MDAYFSCRKTRAIDLPACLKLHPAKNGAEVVGDRAALRAWQQILETRHASRSHVVEQHSDGRTEIVGFALAIFVKKSFAEDEIRNPRPGLNSRIVESVLTGNSVIATYSEVRDANTRGDLQQVTLDTSWKYGSLNASQASEVLVLLARAYLEVFAGYRLGRLLTELVDELDFELAVDHRSVKIVDRFEAYRLANPNPNWNPRRALLMATTESMRNDPHSVAAGLFQHRDHPQFSLTQGEQELLELMLEGMDDGDAGKALNISLPAIKHRWASIFDRVAAVRPDICPLDVSGTRGIQKRQRVLAYVRKHPEELRPFDFNLKRVGN